MTTDETNAGWKGLDAPTRVSQEEALAALETLDEWKPEPNEVVQARRRIRLYFDEWRGINGGVARVWGHLPEPTHGLAIDEATINAHADAERQARAAKLAALRDYIAGAGGCAPGCQCDALEAAQDGIRDWMRIFGAAQDGIRDWMRIFGCPRCPFGEYDSGWRITEHDGDCPFGALAASPAAPQEGEPAQQSPPKNDYFKSLWHDQPTCECGDYVAQHENGTGRCLVCSGSQAPWDGCKQYRPALDDQHECEWEVHPDNRTVARCKACGVLGLAHVRIPEAHQ